MRSLLAAAVVLASMVLAPAAQAGKIVDRFFPTDGVVGGQGGQFNTPRDLAINDPAVIDANSADGWIYVVDDANHRIQAFSPSLVPGGLPIFQFAIGRNVSVSNVAGDAGAVFEKCVTVSDCQAGTTGVLGGMFDNPQGIDVNQATGHFYVRDRDNRRIQEFEADGDFVRAWGWDVVAVAGSPQSREIQTVKVTGTAGTFTLTFNGQTTNPIAFDAAPATVKTELDTLSTIGGAGASVSVSGGPGNATGSSPYLVTFDGGTLAGTDVPAMTALGSGGAAVAIATPNPGATGLETCSVASQCQIGSTGGGAGQLVTSNQAGGSLAVNPVNGNVIVADQGQLAAGGKRVAEYEADGDFVRAWGFNVIPTGGAGDLGTVFEICTVASNCQNVAISSGGGANGAFANSTPGPIAVDSNGVVYASDGSANGSGRVMRFDTTQTAVGTFLLSPILGGAGNPLAAGSSTGALEVDPDNHLYVGRGTPGIVELDLSANPATVTSAHVVDTHMANVGLTQNGLDINATTGDMYVSSSNVGHRVYVLDDDGASGALDATLNPPTNVTADSATLSGTINPGGFPTTYRFEISKNGVTWTPVTADQSIGSGVADVPIDDVASGLDANTLYRFRIVATRGFGNGSVTTAELNFVTDAAPPAASTLPPNHRGATTATLAGTVDANGSPTTYYFEYGLSTGYGARAPIPAGNVGSGNSPKAFSQPIAGLQPDTTYHYRIVAENDQGESFGDDVAFRTRVSAAPPDDRVFELVSPADKLSGGGVGANVPEDMAAGVSGVPSVDGERYVVETLAGPTLVDGAFAYANDWAFAGRTGGGWQSRSPFTHSNHGYAGNKGAVMERVSDDLSLSIWGDRNGHLGLFPEQGDWPQPLRAPVLADWDANWEVFGPTDATEQGNGTGPDRAVSRDGNYAVLTSEIRGLAGTTDATLDQDSGHTVYVDDVSAGLSDSFPGTGVRTPVAVCADGTLIPNRLPSGKQGTQSCASPEPGRSAALISQLGASTTPQQEGGARNVVSRDGSRILFMSPDPNGGPPACSADLGIDTKCPAQVYMRQLDGEGDVKTRWLSRSTVANQDASLMAPVYLEGASVDGDKVFFRTNAPLTADDPNGACGAPCTTGLPSDTSWDLYVYDLPNGPDGDPATPDGDPNGGTLTRVTGGPSGSADPNVMPISSPTVVRSSASLRFASDDGSRAYFTSAGPIPGALLPDSGTITSPGGTPTDENQANLYLYDATRPAGERWTFVARISRSAEASIAACASVAAPVGDALVRDSNFEGVLSDLYNCVRGTADGKFVTFMTDAKLVGGDPDATSADVYAFDADAEQLERISAPQGGDAEPYPCVTADGAPDTDLPCYGDTGIGSPRTSPLPRLGVITDPAEPGTRTAFFQSKSRLVAEDTDDRYDVYQWRDGELSLLSVGTATGAYYNGNSSDGEDVFVMTMDQLSWQDVDAVMDVYDARIGGGIPRPPAPPAQCDPVADACQGPTADSIPQSNSTGSAGGGDATPRERVELTVLAPGARERKRAVRGGVLRLRVRVDGPTRVKAAAKARIGGKRRTVARGSTRVSAAGVATVPLRLGKSARDALKAGKRLQLQLSVSASGSLRRTATVTLKGGRRS